jgi:3-methyladenine DNA glycosylase AlkD
MMYNTKCIIELLQKNGDEKRVLQQQKFAIGNNNTLGVTMPAIRKIAKEIGTNHALAMSLWRTKIHEAKILATMLVDAKLFTEADADEWIFDFDSWDVCDQCCGNLFIKLSFIEQKIFQYAHHEFEFVKRFSYAMIAICAVHWKKREDNYFLQFLPLIIQESIDQRNFVRKAINWALRSIGKRSVLLNDHAIACAETLLEMQNKTAHWIANDAIKELTSIAKQERLMVLEKRKKKLE